MFSSESWAELPSLALEDGAPFSIALWVYQPEDEGNFVVAGQYDQEDGARGWAMTIGSRQLTFRVTGDRSAPGGPATSARVGPINTKRMPSGEWTHIVVTHDGSGVFAGLPSPFDATRYHSLVVEDIPEVLQVNATSETPGLDGTSVMGFRHAELPIHGVQFHPESIATQHGHELLANFLAICGIETRERQAA